MMYGTPGGMPAVFTGALRYGVVGMNSLTLIGAGGTDAGLLVQLRRGASSCNGLRLGDPQVAELHQRATVMILQADIAARQPVGFIVDDRLAVQGDLDAPAFGDDLHLVPFVRGLRHVFGRRDHVVKRTGAVFGGRVAVVSQDLAFVAGEGGILFEGGPDENAAVSALVDRVLKFEGKIAVLLLGAQPRTALLRIGGLIGPVAADEHAVFDLPFPAMHERP